MFETSKAIKMQIFGIIVRTRN